MNAMSMVQSAATGQLEGVSPEKLADGLTHSPLAWGCVILLGMLVATNVFWVRTVISSYEARFSMMEKMYEMLMKTHTGTVTLGLEFQKGLDVMDKVIEQNTRRRED